MKDLGYGKDYKYAHDYQTGYTEQAYLPEPLVGSVFYRPTDRGYEKIILERMAHLRRIATKDRPDE